MQGLRHGTESKADSLASHRLARGASGLGRKRQRLVPTARRRPAGAHCYEQVVFFVSTPL